MTVMVSFSPEMGIEIKYPQGFVIPVGLAENLPSFESALPLQSWFPHCQC